MVNIPHPNDHLHSGIFSGFQDAAAAAAPAASSSSSSSGGYSSGYKEKRASTVPEFTITINSTTPLWFYCAQAQHCQSGMAMVINVNATVNFPLKKTSNWKTNKTLDVYKKAAASVSTNVAPTFSPQGGELSEVAAASTSGSASSGSTSAASPSSAANMNNLREAGMTAMFAVAMLSLFGGFMAVFWGIQWLERGIRVI
jgi:hypothetical protein